MYVNNVCVLEERTSGKMFGAKSESVQFRSCLAQSKNSYFVRKFRNCAGPSRIAQEILYWINKVHVPAQSGNSLDKVRIC